MKNIAIIPGVKGFFGDWVYYCCTAPANTLVSRVLFAGDMYAEDHKWSEMLQRELKEERGNEIASYLTTTDRFFSSLVIGVYAGSPEWLDINISKTADNQSTNEIPEGATNRVGFLQLSGEEKLFALDGQHRLLGMKVALDSGTDISSDDVPVLFVSIGDTKAGHIRARRLFTTINKRAVNVGLGARIALDEDDTIAIITRRLVDSGDFFDKDAILLSSTAALPVTGKGAQALTTAGNLYDVVKTIVVPYAQKKLEIHRGMKKRLIDGKRLSEEEISEYYGYALSFFLELKEQFACIMEYMTATDKVSVVARHRGKHGGHILFRPIGLTLFSHLFNSCKGSTKERITFLRKFLPTEITKSPYVNTIWDLRTQGILRGTGRFPRIHHLCRYMLGFKLNSNQTRSMKHALADINNIAVDDVIMPTKWIDK